MVCLALGCLGATHELRKRDLLHVVAALLAVLIVAKVERIDHMGTNQRHGSSKRIASLHERPFGALAAYDEGLTDRITVGRAEVASVFRQLLERLRRLAWEYRHR